MATLQWTGNGDWFSTDWLDQSDSQSSGPPQPGDTAFFFYGTLLITAADALANPTINTGTLHFATLTADVLPTLDVTNANFGEASYLDNQVNDGAARVIARGTVHFAGSLDANAEITADAAPVFSLDIEAAASGQTFTNTGTLEASNAGTLAVTGTADATLDNAGHILVGNIDDTAGSIAIATTLSNSGSIGVALFGALTATAPVSNASGATIGNTGGTLTLSDGLTNAGLILAQSGQTVILGGVAGSGTISVASSIEIGGAVAAGQVVAFTSNDATLDLTDAAGFAGHIAGLTGHDLIDLLGTVATGSTYENGTLTVLDGATAVATLQIAGLTGALGVASDTHGGSVLTLEQPGTPAQVTGYMVANSADAGSPRHWPLPDPIITYSFDAASGWSAAEQAGFENAMALYSAVANVTFAQVNSGSPDIDIVRGTDGAFTDWQTIGSIETAATVDIDTATPSWQNLYDLGTADPTGYGGYGFTTILHELGHVLGLNHPGPYNETAVITQQIYYTDTHQYAVMSYFDASESGADWDVGGTTINAQTPMLYDISAVQQIYGANTTELTGGATFGFHSTFGTTSLHPIQQYDFSEDPDPVVTLYDGGPNNTLDLSGFTTNATIDLAPGSFSSADGMTDNIAIAYDTTIDSAVGGSGSNLIVVNSGNDTIDGGSGGSNTVAFAGDSGQYALQRHGGTITVAGSGATDILTNVATLAFADKNIAVSAVACFARGTRIRTPAGDMAVEALVAGRDHVLTCAGRRAPIRWIGRRSIELAKHPRPWDVRPVRVRAGAIAPGQPARDLWLSPDHALALGGALVPVRHLVNGASIFAEARRDRVTYLHLELDRHDIVLAEALPTESFLDTGNRDHFDGGTVVRLHPDFAARSDAALRIWEADACAPLLRTGKTLERLRRRLAIRAQMLGHQHTHDPRLRLFAGTRPLPTQRDGAWVFAKLSGTGAPVAVRSRVWVPLHMHPDPQGDARRLGVAVAELRLDGRDVALDDPRLGGGWHAPEADGRWTDGRATLAPGAATTLALRLVGNGVYWLHPQPARARTRA